MPGVAATTTHPSVTIPTIKGAISNIARAANGIVTVVLSGGFSPVPKVGDVLAFKTVATNTWLNGQRLTILTIADSTHFTAQYRGMAMEQVVTAGADTGVVYLTGSVVLPNGRTYDRGDTAIVVGLTLAEYDSIDPKLFTSSYLTDTTP